MLPLRSASRLALLALCAGLTSAPATSHSAPARTPFGISTVAAPQDDGLARGRDLLERLEIGMSALRELGDKETLSQVARVAERLRARLGRARQEQGRGGPNLEDHGTRLDILRHARHAFEEAGKQRHVDYLGRVLHVGELQAGGASPEQLSEAMEDISMGNVVELLNGAGQLWAEFGHETKARQCHELARFYQQRAGGEAREGEARERRTEPQPERSKERLQDRANRIHILEQARMAHARMRHEEMVEYLDNLLLVGRLQQEGASDEEITAAAQHLRLESAIDGLRSAAELFQEWGMQSQAQGCAALAEFYLNRVEGNEEEEHEHEGAEDHEHEREAINLEKRPVRLEIIGLALRAHQEAEHPDRADLLARFLRYGQLQEEGAGDEQLAEAAQGLSMEGAIGSIRSASELYAEWGNGERAELCAALAHHYMRSVEGGEGEGGEQAEQHEMEAMGYSGGDDEEPAEQTHRAMQHLEELHHRMAQLHEQMEELHAHLEELTRKLHDQR